MITYSELSRQLHLQFLQARRIDSLVGSFDFQMYWVNNPNRREELLQLVENADLCTIKTLILAGDDLINMTVRDLRQVAIKERVKQVNQYTKEELVAKIEEKRYEKEKLFKS